MSTWTPERIETLKKLVKDGLSASQIAKQLGGVTRNAVIGKAVRVGCGPIGGGRATAPRAIAPRSTSQRPAPRRSSKATLPLVLGSSFSPTPKPPRPERQEPRPLSACSLEELEPGRCGWPVGDPMSPDFAFCGAETDASAGRPDRYCPHHKGLAHEPAQPKKKTATADLARSLRRYL